MKSSLFGILIFTLGWFASSLWGVMNPSYFTIRVLDDNECKNQKYIVELQEQSITVSGEQIDLEWTPVARVAEAFIRVALPRLESSISDSEFITYKLHANYSNCPSISSEARRVKSGWLLYEFIKDDNIKHVVRAR